MNGAEIPYQLRPSKFIDRQIFMELLSRLIQVRGPENYIYISMGGVISSIIMRYTET